MMVALPDSCVIIMFLCLFQPLVKWLLPSGTKSLSLSTELHRGPALIAFINAQPLSIANRLLSVVSVAVSCVYTVFLQSGCYWRFPPFFAEAPFQKSMPEALLLLSICNYLLSCYYLVIFMK